MAHATGGRWSAPRPRNSRPTEPSSARLVLATHAGYVAWDARGVSPYRPDPLSDPNAWLQEIRDIRLTLPGRDRARGRLVLRELPDPDEDDDRLITGMTLEEISRAIGDAFTPSQLPKFLRDSGIPEDYLTPLDGADNWAYVLAVLERLHNGGSAARRTLREFIARWLEDKLHDGPSPDLRRRVVAQLARQGWFVRGGRLVIGEPQVGEIPPLSPVGREARIATLHPLVRQAVHRYIDSNHMAASILEAFKAVSLRMKELTGLDTDGADLVGKALGGTSPRLQIADQATQTGCRHPNRLPAPLPRSSHRHRETPTPTNSSNRSMTTTPSNNSASPAS